MELTRRSVIAAGVTTLCASALSAPHISRAASALQQPALPFAEDALAPTISAKTLSLHYGKHHKAYFDKLNTLIAPTKYADMDLAAIMAESAKNNSDRAIFNNAAQAWNHVVYWEQFKPGGANRPQGELASQIGETFGGYEGFVKKAVDASDQVFGTGWVWLTRDDHNDLVLVGYEDGNNPAAFGRPAYMGIDVWEHAYYVDYESRKADHIRAVLDKAINWNVVGDRIRA